MKKNEKNLEGCDICCVCNAVGEDGAFKDVNEVDFELLCPKCEKCRCSNCDFLRSKMKFKEERFFCRFRGSISNPNEKVCDHWKIMEN